MDRTVLIKLFRGGMPCPARRQRLWVARCFEVTLRPGKVVEVDEYEGTTLEDAVAPRRLRKDPMTHVGRSVLDLATGHVTEQVAPRGPAREPALG